jgi:ABC-2 type transport system permease protein
MPRMDAGLDTFALTFRPSSSATCWPAPQPAIQLNVDATRMSQAFVGSGYIQTIVTRRGPDFRASGIATKPAPPVDLACAPASIPT